MRAAGIGHALERLGWDYKDDGDIDFTVPSHLQHLDSASLPMPHRHLVQAYHDWLGDATRELPLARHLERLARQDWPLSWMKRKNVAESGSWTPQPGACACADSLPTLELVGSGLKLVHDAVAGAASAGRFVLTVGGDHSVAAGSISGLSSTYPDLGVIWIDAHADANTPCTSPSMHYHGMPAAHLLGWFKSPLKGFEWFRPCLDESRLAYIGLRDVDEQEARMLRESNVHIYTMRDVDKHGIAKVIETALLAIDANGHRPLHLSLDIDGIDPAFAPGTGTCARGGLTYREIHYICEELALTKRLVSMDLVEINPSLDPLPETESMHGDNPLIAPSPPTVQLAAELVLSALGKEIM